MVSVIELFIQDEDYLNQQLLNTPKELQDECRYWIGYIYDKSFSFNNNYFSLDSLEKIPKKFKLDILTLLYMRMPEYIVEEHIDDRFYYINEYSKWWWAPLLKIWPKLNSIVNNPSSSLERRFFKGYPPREGGVSNPIRFTNFMAISLYDSVWEDLQLNYSAFKKGKLLDDEYLFKTYYLNLKDLKKVMFNDYFIDSKGKSIRRYLLSSPKIVPFPLIFWFDIPFSNKKPFMNFWEFPWNTVK